MNIFNAQMSSANCASLSSFSLLWHISRVYLPLPYCNRILCYGNHSLLYAMIKLLS